MRRRLRRGADDGRDAVESTTDAATDSPRGRFQLVGTIVLALVTVVAVAVFLITPARTWVAQRQQLDRVRGELAEVEEVNAQYAARIEILQTDTEIVRIAREQYNLVTPGQEAYVVLPVPTTTPPVAAP